MCLAKLCLNTALEENGSEPPYWLTNRRTPADLVGSTSSRRSSWCSSFCLPCATSRAAGSPDTFTGDAARGCAKRRCTAHVVSSVGWLGAVAGFLALALSGLTSSNERMLQAAYLTMGLTGWARDRPLSSAASLVSGLHVQSLGTSWGLFRHYWVIFKLVINLAASALLILHMRPVDTLARVAAEPMLFSPELRGMRIQVAGDAAAAVIVLVLATALAVYKPSGLTRQGWRKLHAQRASRQP